MPVYRGEEERRHEARYDGSVPGYRRNEPESQNIEPERVFARPQDFRRGLNEEMASYKQQEMEKQTIILEKAAPDQGFGIAVSGGLDNPHNETGDTAIIVSDVVVGSPADGLLRVNDVILSVNGVNVENVEHGVAVEALKHSGYSVTLVILRGRPSAPSSPMSVPSVNEPIQRARPSNGTSKVPTNITLSKQPGQGYGLSLGTILFVKDLDHNGPAGRDGKLEPGDVILKINNERVDDLSRPVAVEIMRNAPERLDLVVLKNKDVPADMPSRIFNEPNISMTRSAMVESGQNGMNGQELFAYKRGQDNWDGTLRSTTTYSVSSGGRRSDTDRDIDARKDKKFHGEPHLISFRRTGVSLGIQVAGGNAVGIFAAAVKDGSPAQVSGLRIGDQVLSANEIEFKDITREEAVLILLSLPEEVTLLVQYKKSVYDRSKEEPGDSFYVKAQFHYNSSDEDELTFRRGEVFHVLDTMNGGTIGSWRAQRVLQNGAETEVGIIPNKCRAEQLAIAQDLEAKKGPNTKQKSGTLKRKDTKTHTPKKKQYQAADQLDETSFQLDVKYPAYERVVRRKAGFVRPVVLLGPIADICRDKLMIEYPEKFTSPATFGRFDPKQQSGIKLSAVRDNISSGKHSLLDVTPEGVDMLNFVGLEPIVIFLKPANKQLIKDLRHDLTSKAHSARFVKKLYDQAETLYAQHSYLFTGVITLERNNKWYIDCVSTVQTQQDDVIWMPEQMNNQHEDEELVLRMPRVSVNFDPDQSHLDSTADYADRSESLAVSPGNEEMVVAVTQKETESAPPAAVQAYVVTHRGEDEVQAVEPDARERDDIEQREKERDFQRRQEEYERRQTEGKEYSKKQEDDERQERDYQRKQQEDYERQIEQREYELRQYEENRRGYDNDVQHRDERKPYIPPGIRVLPGSLPPVVSLKKTDSNNARPQDEPFQGESVQLRHVERDAEGEKFDERIGVKVSDVFDMGKDIQAGSEYREDARRTGNDRRQRSDSDEEETRYAQDSRVVSGARNTHEELQQQETEPIEESLVRTTVKPVEAAATIDFDDVFSSRQANSNRVQTTTTTTRSSYQVNNQPRNTVIDTRGGKRVENHVFSNYYPAKARAQVVNLDTEDGYGQEKRREEPEMKVEYESRVASEPPSYNRRPQGYDDGPAPGRRPPPPSDDTTEPPNSKPYSSLYPRPFGTQSSTSYTEFRRKDYAAPESRQYNDGYQMPVAEDAAYRYGSTAYRNPATTEYDDANRDATRSYSEI